MRGQSMTSMLVLGLAAVYAAAPAWGDSDNEGIKWSGPGWYMEAPKPPFGLALGAGPFGDQQTCESEKARWSYSAGKQDFTGLMFCGFLDSDPNN